VKKLEDLFPLENFPEINQLVIKNGLTLLQAYKLANEDKLTERRVAAAKQAALNAVSGKQHLQSDTAHGTGAVTVPAAVKEQYRLFNPNITEAEMQTAYARYLGETKFMKG
jgi:hypothetical protein